MSVPNYATRTNYFHVTDPEALKNLLARVHVGEDKIDLFLTRKDNDGNQLYGFGCEDSIQGLPVRPYTDPDAELEEVNPDELEDEDFEYSYDLFVKELQTLLPPGEVCIILESGHDKLRSVFGDVLVITHDETKYNSLRNMALAMARQILNNPNWDTELDY